MTSRRLLPGLLLVVTALAWLVAVPLLAEAQAPKRGGTLRVSYGNEVAGLDFHTSPGYEMMWVGMNVGCGLINITPDGKFLYGSERTSSTLAGFKVDPAHGTLSPIGSVPTEKQPRGFNIDASGRYLLAVGQLSHGMSSYKIDADSGKLTKLKEYPMGKNPNWVEIVDIP